MVAGDFVTVAFPIIQLTFAAIRKIRKNKVVLYR